MNAQRQPIAIVGPGRLGQALGRLLNKEGFPVAYVAARRGAAARHAARFIGAGVAVGMNSPQIFESPIILLTTSDEALKPLARQLAALSKDWQGHVILHTSGSVPSSVLLPFKRRGAAIGSLHPFQSIPNPVAGIRNLRGCAWAVQGDPAAREVALRWVKALSGTSFLIADKQKSLYHAAAFLVCPTAVTLMHHSVKLLRLCGVSEKMARPMLGGIVREAVNNFMQLGGRRALTGPATRGDWVTIQKHVTELRRIAPEVLPAYRELVRLMAALAGRSIPVEVFGPSKTRISSSRRLK